MYSVRPDGSYIGVLLSLRSCGSLSLLSELYRMINFGSYSVNYLLIFFYIEGEQ